MKKSFKKHNLAIIDFNAAVKLKTTSRFRNSGFKSLNQHYVPFGLSESSPSSIGHEYCGTNVKKKYSVLCITLTLKEKSRNFDNLTAMEVRQVERSLNVIKIRARLLVSTAVGCIFSATVGKIAKDC